MIYKCLKYTYVKENVYNCKVLTEFEQNLNNFKINLNSTYFSNE